MREDLLSIRPFFLDVNKCYDLFKLISKSSNLFNGDISNGLLKSTSIISELIVNRLVFHLSSID